MVNQGKLSIIREALSLAQKSDQGKQSKTHPKPRQEIWEILVWVKTSNEVKNHAHGGGGVGGSKHKYGKCMITFVSEIRF